MLSLLSYSRFPSVISNKRWQHIAKLDIITVGYRTEVVLSTLFFLLSIMVDTRFFIFDVLSNNIVSLEWTVSKMYSFMKEHAKYLINSGNAIIILLDFVASRVTHVLEVTNTNQYAVPRCSPK